jgi:opine dehydrogenase
MSDKVTVLGGGNGGVTAAAELSKNGFKVTLFEFAELADNISEIISGKKVEYSGVFGSGTAEIAEITHDIGEAVEDAEMIYLVIPSMYHHVYADVLWDKLQDGQHLCLLPGTFGALDMIARMRSNGMTADITISESDALPYATRRQGETKVRVFNKLPEFGLGVFPSNRTESALKQVKAHFPAAAALPNTLASGLNNANPALHPLGVLLNVGRIEYSKGNFYYYEEGFTESVARTVEALDKERLALGAALGVELPTLAKGLQDAGYGPVGDLWETINGSRALTPILGPTYVGNRYLTEDIPIGLNMWSSLAKQFGVPTPLIDSTIAIGEVVCQLGPDVYRRSNESCGVAKMSLDELKRYVAEGNF